MFNVIELRKHFCFPAEESLCIGRCVAHLYCWNNCNKNCTDSGMKFLRKEMHQEHQTRDVKNLPVKEKQSKAMQKLRILKQEKF